jgi:hypothetical protein
MPRGRSLGSPREGDFRQRPRAKERIEAGFALAAINPRATCFNPRRPAALHPLARIVQSWGK